MKQIILVFGIIVCFSLKLCISEHQEDQTTKYLQIHILKLIENCTHTVRKGDTLVTNYVGSFENGTIFETSVEPLEFQIGLGKLIKGWEFGLLGMCENEKRKLIIPSDLGYGDDGAGLIPPKSTLIFEVKLSKLVQSETKQKNMTNSSYRTTCKMESFIAIMLFSVFYALF